MGLPISGSIAEAVMQSIETKIMAQYRPRLWLRYVDDTFVIINRNDLDHFHAIIKHQIFQRRRTKQPVAFPRCLSTETQRWQINTSVYRKSSTSEIILHYSSNHPTSHKRLCVKTLFDRAQLYCLDGTTLALDHSYLFNMFRSCGYPLSFIRRAMRRKIPRGHGQR